MREMNDLIVKKGPNILLTIDCDVARLENLIYELDRMYEVSARLEKLSSKSDTEAVAEGIDKIDMPRIRFNASVSNIDETLQFYVEEADEDYEHALVFMSADTFISKLDETLRKKYEGTVVDQLGWSLMTKIDLHRQTQTLSTHFVCGMMLDTGFDEYNAVISNLLSGKGS